MVDRVSRARHMVGTWLLTAGLSAAVLAGAGVAVADEGTDSSSGGDGSSTSAKQADTQPDPGPEKTDPGTTAPTDTTPDADPSTDPDTTTDPVEEDVEKPAKKRDRDPAPKTESPKVSPQPAPATVERSITEAERVTTAEPAVEEAVEEAEAPVEVVDTPEPPAQETATADPVGAVTDAVSSAITSLFDALTPNGSPHAPAAQPQLWTAAAAARREIETAFAAPSLAQPEATVTTSRVAATSAGPTLINVIGTLAWSVFDVVTEILEGPPSVPAGSSVSVGRSELQIDCGDGYNADADWYYPTTGTPDKLIYFQHGFLARAGFYNLTAAELAERNNAIVVAPSITSNFFACDACNLGSDPMHAAVAQLFTGDRTALLASAQAAGYQGALPDEFVFAGHSAGGQLAPGAAGYYYELAPAAEKDDLIGVLIYDTSASGGGLARALDRLPTTLPVLHIAANPSFYDTFGNANPVLEQKRPGQFNGVLLVAGSHSDAFRSSGLFGFTQLVVSIGTGFSLPENVDAVQVLSQGWLTDMYAGTVYNPSLRTGIYGGPNEIVDIPTGTGTDARAYVLPVPPPNLNAIESLIVTLLDSVNFTTLFAGCAVAPNDPAAVPAPVSARHSTFQTALSLDVTSRKGQSVGQQCVNE